MIYKYIDDIEIYRIYVYIIMIYTSYVTITKYIYIYIYIQCTYIFHQPSYLLNS